MTTEQVSPDPAQPSPFLIDIEDLRAVVSEPVLKRGIAYFKENRVVEHDWDARHIWSTVEGSRPGEPYWVNLYLDEDDEITVDCDCPFDYEPFCKHAVATLLAFGAQQPVSSLKVQSAADEAIEQRIKRGRREVVVAAVETRAGFGTWRARSITRSGPTARSYVVQIRSIDERINFCSCPDFAVNRLGTCKHIEAVLLQARKLPARKGGKGKAQERLPSFVYLAWDVPDAPRVRIRWAVDADEQIRQRLSGYFDDDGMLVGELPTAFHRLNAEIETSDAVQIGLDAIRHIQRLSEDLQHRTRREEIKREILRAELQLPGVRARLYPYQAEGVAFLASNGRALLADDMGLGKTLQAIAAARWLVDHADVRRILVVCPASLKHQWAREIERFTALPVQIVQGPVSAREVQYRSKAVFAVANYELILRDVATINKVLAPDLMILDEAQRIKNWRTKTADAIKAIETHYAFVLTGTPLENRLEDLYSVMQVIDPRVLGPLWRYMLDFHVSDERGRVLGYRNLSELRRRLTPVMLRRDRRLVRDQLPDRVELRLDLPLTPKQRTIHNEAMSNANRIAQIMERRPLTPSEEHRLMASLQQARMACDAAGLVDKKTKGAPKLDELSGLLESFCLEDDRKVVVFSEWERMTAMAENVASKLGLGVVRLHGGVPTAKRGDLMARFADDPGTQVFISTDAGGVGLNLQAASVLINLDVPWNPAVLEQRVARVHRLGQKESVQVVLMSSQDSYEQRVARLADGKRELFKNVVTEEATQDVVGLSKRLLEELAQSVGSAADKADEGDKAQPIDEAAEAALPPSVEQEPDSEAPEPALEDAIEPTEAPEPVVGEGDEPAIRTAVVHLQTLLGTRIERVLATQGGLMVVVDQVDELAEAAVERASNGVSVAIIDARTRAALEKLGPSSPLASAQDVDLGAADSREVGATVGQQHRAVAPRKLRSAEVLIETGCIEDGLGLTVEAMLSVVAGRAGRRDVPSRGEAAVWLYSEAIPAGAVSTEEAVAISRCLALTQSASVPPWLAREVLDEARKLL